MNAIAFFDTEVARQSKRVLDIGGVKENGAIFHSPSVSEFIRFLTGSDFLGGHNILQHDLKYVHQAVAQAGIPADRVVDTLYLSPLLFPAKPYHALVKDDKLQSEELNNPLNDSIKAKELFEDEVAAFNGTDIMLQEIYYLLLGATDEFGGFFRFLGYRSNSTNTVALIRTYFMDLICASAPIEKWAVESPIELAYALALINCRSRYSITPPWVLLSFPKVETLIHVLRNKPCRTGCRYCNKALDIHQGLKRYFGFDAYRTYDGEPLQERAVQAAVSWDSLLAIFPTGGGKSLTFQLPALMAGENTNGLTVVISPLQSLMKDQVDHLEQHQITDAVTINGMLDPIERAESIARIRDGRASILYISPETLRSRTIEHLLLGRNVVRFVIDEAHCFSSWGQDFRVDYLYIADFIASLQEKKNMQEPIPVSCFTATAKQQVIEDIRTYFKERLNLELQLYTSGAGRTNLHYQVFEKGTEEEKYNAVRDLIAAHQCPTIVYVARTRKALDLAARLAEDGFEARAFHGRMERQQKIENQNAFIAGTLQIIVATSAFGMGVDKKDVGLVIHYNISDSLENYVQEAGRAGRDVNIRAACYVLFNEEDLSKHFALLNQSKINIYEIKQVWNAIKFITKFKSTVQRSALEIARVAGWNEHVEAIETRVTTAIAALEDAGYVKRQQNAPRIFADSIRTRTAQEAIDRINGSQKFSEEQKVTAIRIIRALFSAKSRKDNAVDAESRVDYIADNLGIDIKAAIAIINLLREEKILSDSKDLTAFIQQQDNENHSLAIVACFGQMEGFLGPLLTKEEQVFNLKVLNERAEEAGCKEVSVHKLKTIINFWAIKHWIKRSARMGPADLFTAARLLPADLLRSRTEQRLLLSRFIVSYLFDKVRDSPEAHSSQKSHFVAFSVLELQEAFASQIRLFKQQITLPDIEEALLYLSRIGAMKIEGGFLVIYNKLTVKRLEQNSRVQYKEKDYQKLSQHYEHRIQQIHIVGEYAHKMVNDYKEALQFVDDYFQLSFPSFLGKYFKGSRTSEIRRNITPGKYQQLFGRLSEEQRAIIDDKTAPYIVVAAGPGSGKTRVLVHKLAALLLMEDVKTEQLLMLTFSRAAATEFKKRLLALVGQAAHFIDIKTFHSYCFDLLGKVGDLSKSGRIIKMAVDRIRAGEVEQRKITKTVLVIDEAQDMDDQEFELIKELMDQNENIRVIAVGDDDQNIYQWRGADSKYMQYFIDERAAVKYELLTNYRSKHNLVAFTNQFLQGIRNRLKQRSIVANQMDDGAIKIVRYQSENLIVPLVEDVLQTDLSGTTCILTHKNADAFQIAGLLKQCGRSVRLIQSNDGFDLYNLIELRFFCTALRLDDQSFFISDESWEEAKRELKHAFSGSAKLYICLNLIRDFEQTHVRKKYRTDFDVFVRESKLEDFISGGGDLIMVSTIHKAKGREFDHVFLLLNHFELQTEEHKRQLYVAMTRAKRRLTIHMNNSCFDNIQTTGLIRLENNRSYPPPRHLALSLSHRDLNLGYFYFVQSRIQHLRSGDSILVSEEGCRNKAGELILKFAKAFSEKVARLRDMEFRPAYAEVDFIVYWPDEQRQKEVAIVLPRLYFKRGDRAH